MVVKHFLWKLFHVENGIGHIEADIIGERETFLKLQREKTEAEEKLKEAKRDQALSHKGIAKVEKAVSQKRKQVDEKVSCLVYNLVYRYS
jgi:structural maintenance of chromosome 1